MGWKQLRTKAKILGNRATLQSAPKVRPSRQPPWLDTIFSGIGAICQVLLFGLGYWVYEFTVKPVYQKELLSEEIAKAQIDLNVLNSNLSESRRQAQREAQLNASLQGQAKLLTNSLNAAQARASILRAEATSAVDAASSARAQVTAAREELDTVQSRLRTAFVESSAQSIVGCMQQTWEHTTYTAETCFDRTFGDFHLAMRALRDENYRRWEIAFNAAAKETLSKIANLTRERADALSALQRFDEEHVGGPRSPDQANARIALLKAIGDTEDRRAGQNFSFTRDIPARIRALTLTPDH